MVNRNLLRQFDVSDADTLEQINQDFDAGLTGWIADEKQVFETNKIVDGRVLSINGDDVLVDVGYKSEGVIKLEEFRDEGTEQIIVPNVGDTIQVLLETVEDEYGVINLSYRKAKRQKEWEDILRKHKEGDVVSGMVTRKIKGGLLVNIGVNVFLPASQVDIRRPPDIGDYINRTIECKILKIDEARRNIVVSRRKLLEDQRTEMKEKLLREIEPGQVRKGVVKNIADFGAFVDLGGIDGLLHITDMAWDRVTDPRKVVKIDEQLEVYILSVDREKEKIALSLKHKTPNPWANVEAKYPVGSKHEGEVVNVMSYGAFVKLEPGIEGLVHISEMSWTRRVNHPTELVNTGDEISVVILGVDKAGQQLSLGMKQTQENPWTRVAEKYPVDALVEGKVRNLTNYGAFVELEEGIDGLLHVSDMSWTRKISHPNEMLEKGQAVKCKILSVDQERRRIALGMKQLEDDPWNTNIPAKYQPGQVVSGTVTKITNFGVFVGLEDGLEGLLHISELADHKVENPEDVVKVGEKIEVKILRVDTDDRKIGLSRKRVEWAEDDLSDVGGESAAAAPAAKEPKKPRGELKGGLGGGGPLIAPPTEGGA